MKQLKEKEYEEFQQYLYNKSHGYIWIPDTLELICAGNEYDSEKIGKQMLEMKVKLQNGHISHMLNDKRKKYVIRSLRKGIQMTLEAERAITVFLLDYPLDVCLEGARSRVGVQREEIPWVEEELDEEFRQWIIDFPKTKLPQIYQLLEQYGKDKEIYIFRSREDAEHYLENI